ncbi:acetyl-CoA C-acetyltransferase [Branchiibius hedensis]|uniref:Acetyl-CoA C-acetyltransferase n=1 Tax=Branchiibius hedensis TaxID=672460 RepID=A0A2Y8ZWE6_9MICO|nr:steroid 3-ketoacyl-CoA thiolase [Branchiibius hedensis]PWJ27055.1 acetyl-CoA C-acetyltransferase [Branchiibius hedensis]SSA35866.1 acetyl-CoA C-acetyltransferase [Branchiibius hedensis]
MGEPVIVDVVRSPFARRRTDLAGVHPATLLGTVQQAALDRLGLDASEVGQVIGGCVTQAGEQSSNVTRTAWLSRGLPSQVAATTLDAQCGSGQQSIHLIAALIAVGAIDVGLACGVESMSRVPLMANVVNGPGKVRPEPFPLEMPGQFVGADRIARRRGFSRDDLDAFGARSQQRAMTAWAEHRFDADIVPITVTDAESGERVVERDSGLRETTLETLGGLDPVIADGLHTPGTSSQVTDGAATAVLMDRSRAIAEGLRPRGRLLAQALVGAQEPEYLLDGPVQAIERVLGAAGLTVGDVDIFEINEAFAAVPMSSAQVHGIDETRLNVNGGAIALGHPVGATGVRLVGAALRELERIDGEIAVVAICAGGAMATGAVVQRC